MSNCLCLPTIEKPTINKTAFFATLLMAHFGKIPTQMNRTCARIMTRVITGVHFSPSSLKSKSHSYTKT